MDWNTTSIKPGNEPTSLPLLEDMLYDNSTSTTIIDDNDGNGTGRGFSRGRDRCNVAIPNLMTKYYLVTVCGTLMASVSAIENIIVFLLFASRPQFKSTHMFFMKILALCDILVSLSYIATFPVEVIMNMYQSIFISKIFHSYIRPLFTVSQIALTSSTFLIMAASFERYTTSCRRGFVIYTQRKRLTTTAIAIGCAVGIKGTIYYETTILEEPRCMNNRRYYIMYSELGKNRIFNSVWMFYMRHIFTVFLPFISIAYMNCAIVMAIRRNKMSLRGAMIRATVGNRIAEDSNSSVRRATRMLLLVVASYLGGNLLNVGIAVWEHIDLISLIHTYTNFYMIVTDVISLLTIITTALRLPIYVYCNVQVRSELRVTLSKHGGALYRRLSVKPPARREERALSTPPHTLQQLQLKKWHSLQLKNGGGRGDLGPRGVRTGGGRGGTKTGPRTTPIVTSNGEVLGGESSFSLSSSSKPPKIVYPTTYRKMNRVRSMINQVVHRKNGTASYSVDHSEMTVPSSERQGLQIPTATKSFTTANGGSLIHTTSNHDLTVNNNNTNNNHHIVKKRRGLLTAVAVIDGRTEFRGSCDNLWKQEMDHRHDDDDNEDDGNVCGGILPLIPPKLLGPSPLPMTHHHERTPSCSHRKTSTSERTATAEETTDDTASMETISLLDDLIRKKEFIITSPESVV